ncbi:MAG: hypothetical protein WDM79_00770 [Terricaulis sp.]
MDNTEHAAAHADHQPELRGAGAGLFLSVLGLAAQAVLSIAYFVGLAQSL